jgi:hypothetical protein
MDYKYSIMKDVNNKYSLIEYISDGDEIYHKKVVKFSFPFHIFYFHEKTLDKIFYSTNTGAVNECLQKLEQF